MQNRATSIGVAIVGRVTTIRGAIKKRSHKSIFDIHNRCQTFRKDNKSSNFFSNKDEGAITKLGAKVKSLVFISQYWKSVNFIVHQTNIYPI